MNDDDSYTFSVQSFIPPRMRRRRKTSAPSWSSYQTTPITKLYELNHQVLQAFDGSLQQLLQVLQQNQSQNQQSHSQPLTHQTLTLGLQFCETALVELPKHGYYTARRHERDRMQSCLEAVRVTQCLNETVLKELSLDNNAQDLALQLQALSELALRRVQEASQDQTNHAVAATSQETTSTTEATTSSSPLLSCDSLPSWDWMSSWCQDLPQVLVGTAGTGPPPKPEGARTKSTTATARPATVLYGSRSSTRHLLDDDNDAEGGGPDYVVVDSCDPDAAAVKLIPEEEPDWVPVTRPDPGSSMTTTWQRRRSKTTKEDAPGQLQDTEHYATPGASSDSSATTRQAVSSQRTKKAYQRPQDSTTNSFDDNERRLLEQALFLSGWDASGSNHAARYEVDDNDTIGATTGIRAASASSDTSSASTTASASTILPLDILAKCYHEDFDQLRSSGQVRISFANTHQGRVPGSTNGCTVIAPLLCIHHLLDHAIPDPGLPDAVIEHVIDDETPAILSQLRQQLGLSPNAFLIPSDAHDYLIDNGQLSQDQFLDVIGGNVLDDEHLTKFVQALEQPTTQKVAACLFFHEHVVTILKLQREKRRTLSLSSSTSSCWYDIIDGLPLKETLARVGQSDESLVGTLSLSESESIDAFLPKTARIRCLSAQALTACLRWYACSKFTPENVKYIDQYSWNDNSCDFDPRVFQGFIWGTIDS